MILPFWFQITVITFYGLVLGSFSTALYWRSMVGKRWALSDGGDDVRAEQKNFFARSECPHCGHKLGLKDLIPLFSWLACRGKCRYCKSAISKHYPLIELTVLAGCIGLWLMHGFTPTTFIVSGLLPFLVALFLVDVRFMILPDPLILSGVILGLVYFAGLSVFEKTADILLLHLSAAAVYAGLIWLTGRMTSFVLGRSALGFGDVKLFGLAGLWLGFYMMPFFFILAGLLGVFWGGVWRIKFKKPLFPFGPSLIAAFYICLFFTDFRDFL